MSDFVLSTHDLVKKYKNAIALDHFNMSVGKGQIYGFVGENGAGKTTFMRIISGLIFETQGSFALLDAITKNEQCEARKRIGCMIESPKFYSDLTAKENLLYISKLRKIDKSKVNQMLELVSLTDSNKSARHFSLGMKQRLGLAIAMLSEPEFLMLDEPINGLDPKGISDFRDLIKNINKEHNTTILISSHLLSELFQVATDYGFIHKGKMIKQISADELKQSFEEKVVVTINDTQTAEKILKSENINYSLSDHLFIVSQSIETIINLLSNCGIHQIENSTANLEEYYFKLINENN